jgi:hypothetical protein
MAEYIKQLYSGRTFITAFADPLKREVAAACGVTVQHINENKRDYRLLLQAWGTEYRRNHFGDDYWINQLYQEIIRLSLTHKDAIIVVPDVRFLNEYKSILKCNGVMVRVERLECDVDDQHASETGLDNQRFDIVIHNNCTKEAFQLAVNSFMQNTLKIV